MHLESEGIETGQRERPYVARVSFGTRKQMKIMQEWEAGSLAAAVQEADDWMYEYIARLGNWNFCEPAAIADRQSRLHPGMPALPDPCEIYRNAMNGAQGMRALPLVEAPMPRPAKRKAPSSAAAIRKIVDGARRAGIDVAGVRVWPDGSIAAFDTRWTGATPDDCNQPV